MDIEKVKQVMMKEVERLSKEKYVLAVGLLGSFSKASFSKFSDVDLFVLTNGKEMLRSYKIINGIEFEEFFNPYKYVEKLLKKSDEDYARTIWEIKPIMDKNNKMEELKGMLKNYKPSKEAINWAIYGIQHNLQKIQSRFEKGKSVDARVFSLKLAEDVAHVWYIINRIPSGNFIRIKILEDIELFKIKPDNFEKDLKTLFLGNADKAELIETAKKLSEETLKKLGGRLPQNIIMGKEKVL